MRNTAILWVFATTGVLILVAIMAATGFPFDWIFYVTIIGQIMVGHMVYKVLTDPYSTTKTFDDFYENHPMGQEK
ncbi:MAG TPA: hypothetical protein VKZ93_01840 [Arenibacter sp.]|nr:hypothetical protein [Arenibacter sp.]